MRSLTVFTRKSRLRPLEFLILGAKRLLQHNLPAANSQRGTADGGTFDDLFRNHLTLRGILVILPNEIVATWSEWTEAHNALRFASYHLFDL
jgi:hypothetical protein